MPKNAALSMTDSCHTTELRWTHNRHTQSSCFTLHKSRHGTRLAPSPMPLCATFTPTYSWTHNTQHLFLHPQTFAGAPTLSTRSHIQHSRHTGEQARHVRSSTLPLSFEIRHRRPRLGGANWVRPTRAYLPESRSRVPELEGERQDESLGAGHGAATCPGPGPARGAPPGPGRARGEPEPGEAARREQDWRRVQGGSPSKQGADVRLDARSSRSRAPPTGSRAVPASPVRPRLRRSRPTPGPLPGGPGL